jgi:hypothetical protein
VHAPGAVLVLLRVGARPAWHLPPLRHSSHVGSHCVPFRSARAVLYACITATKLQRNRVIREGWAPTLSGYVRADAPHDAQHHIWVAGSLGPSPATYPNFMPRFPVASSRRRVDRGHCPGWLNLESVPFTRAGRAAASPSDTLVEHLRSPPRGGRLPHRPPCGGARRRLQRLNDRAADAKLRPHIDRIAAAL